LAKSLKTAGTVFALATLLWFCSGGSSRAQPVDLGAARNFGLLVNDGDLALGNHCIISSSIGILGGNSVLEFDCRVTRNLVDDNEYATRVTLGTSSHVLGKCALSSDGLTLEKGATCGTKSTDGSSVELAKLHFAIADEESFQSVVDGLPATQSLPDPIAVPDFQVVTVSDTIHGGLNVVHVPWIVLSNYATLYLSGGVKDRLLLVVDGVLALSTHSRIIPIGGLLAKNLYISAESLTFSYNFPGTGTELNGTVRVAGGCALGSAATINGALICDGGDAAIGDQLRLNFVPSALKFP
jgi:hypothetical protein